MMDLKGFEELKSQSKKSSLLLDKTNPLGLLSKIENVPKYIPKELENEFNPYSNNGGTVLGKIFIRFFC